MATIKISSLPPAPALTGSGTPLGTDLIPATDILDNLVVATGVTKKYTQASFLNFYLKAMGFTTYEAVVVATTGALTATYDNGTSGVDATLTNAGAQAAISIDGVSLSLTQRVLVKNQGSTFQNGIYVVTTLGTSSANWVLTRATDYDTPAEIIQYGVVLSTRGTMNEGLMWQETSAGPFTIGTSSIVFAQFEITDSTGTVSSITGTANQVLANGTSATAQIGAVTLTLPQDIALTSSPSFIAITASAGIVTSGAVTGGFTGQFLAFPTTASLGSLSLLSANNAGNYSNVLTNASTSAARTWILPNASGTIALGGSTIPSVQGTANQVLVNGTSGSPVTGTAIILTTPQDIGTASSPTFLAITASGGAVVSGSLGGGFSGTFQGFSTTASMGSTSLVAANNVGNFANILTNASTAAARTWTLPDASGTIALTSGASGIVNPGLINQMAYYASAGTTLSGLTIANQGVLTTDGSGAPAWLTLIAGQIPIGTTSGAPVAAAINSGTNITVANGSGSITVNLSGIVPGTLGGTGVNNGASTFTMGGSHTLSGAFTSTFTFTNTTSVTFPTSGTLATTATASGIINSGTINQLAYYAAAGTTLSGVGPGSTGQLFQSNGVGSAPAYTTATYPSVATSSGTILRADGTNWVASTSTFADTYTASNLLYSNGSNTVTGLATANSAVLVTNSTGVPAWSSTMTNGQVIIGSTGATPTAATLTAGPGISIANGAGSITISGTGSGIGWTEVTGTSQAMSADNGYVSSNAGLVTLTLPVTAAFGTAIAVVGKGVGGWSIAQNSGQSIQTGNQTTTIGVGGSLASTNRYDSITLICTTANTIWTAIGAPQSAGLTFV